MNNFEYIQPADLKAACRELEKSEGKAVPVAGGTDLLGLLKDELLAPQKVFNLKTVPGLDKIDYRPGKELRIGALVKIGEIAAHPLIREKFKTLARAAVEVGSPQLRNMGTLGGNLCQRPRCWYFRGPFNCLRKGGDACYAVDGENKYHCIVGGGPCYIVHPSDTAVALLALNATVHIARAKEEREVPLKEFYLLPEQDVQRETVLQPGEIVTGVRVPEPPKGIRSGYLKSRERGIWDFALSSVALVLQVEGNQVRSGRAAFGGVAPAPWQEEALNRRLAGFSFSESALEKLSAQVLASAVPLEQNAYKQLLTRGLFRKLFRRLMTA